MKHSFKGRRTNSLSTKIILLVEVVLILSSIVFCAVSIVNSRIGIRKSIQQRMLDIANCASGSVNGDTLEKLTAADQGTPEYQAVYNSLAVFRDNVELKYVYGIRDEGDGTFTFTVDPTIDDPALFGEEVKYTEALASASRGTAAVDEAPYTDAWGMFYSAYSPVFNSSGEVAGIIAADFSTEWFESQLSERTRATVISYGVILIVTLMVAAVLSLITVRPFAMRQEQLSLEVEKRADDYERLFLQVVQSMADAVDARDTYTNGHSRRVSQYSVKLAEAMGWEKDRVNDLRYAALLHDIGNVGVPDSILNSPRRLTEVEFGIIKSHTDIGGDILKNGIMAETAEKVARCHHERYDGNGYPLGLKGEALPEEARIVAVADAFDAMNSQRAYRKAFDRGHVRQELEDGRGKQFDPHLVELFVDLWDRGLLDSVQKDDSVEESVKGAPALLQEVVEAFVSQNAADDIDITTGILNRSAGEAMIAQAMQEENGCLVFFDLDNLKRINDINGHEAGDRALRLIGDILTENSERALYCRLGGDEFLYFMKDVSKEEAEERIQGIIDGYDARKTVDISAASISAGLAMSTPAEPYSKVYNKADKALYHVKQNGKNSYSFYEADSDFEGNGGVDVSSLVSGIKSSGSYTGALDVDYRQFAKLYEYISNLGKRFSHPFNLILISLETIEGEVPVMEEMEKDMFYMEQSIQQTIRNVDILTRYGRQQFLIILLGAAPDGVKIAVDRIFRGYYKMAGSGAYSPSYLVAEIDNPPVDLPMQRETR